LKKTTRQKARSEKRQLEPTLTSGEKTEEGKGGRQMRRYSPPARGERKREEQGSAARRIRRENREGRVAAKTKGTSLERVSVTSGNRLKNLRAGDNDRFMGPGRGASARTWTETIRAV